MAKKPRYSGGAFGTGGTGGLTGIAGSSNPKLATPTGTTTPTGQLIPTTTPTVPTSADFMKAYQDKLAAAQLQTKSSSAVATQPPTYSQQQQGFDFKNNPFFDTSGRPAQDLPAPPPFVPNAEQDARGLQAQQGYMGNNPVLKTIQNYFNWGDKLTKNADGSWNTSIQLPFGPGSWLTDEAIIGKASTKIFKNLLKTGISTKGEIGDKIIKTIKSIFTRDVMEKAANGRWSKTNKLNWWAIGGIVGISTWIVKESLGGKVFSNFIGAEEAMQSTIGVQMIAEKRGTPEQRKEARDLAREALEFDASGIPYKQSFEALAKFKDIANRSLDLADKIDSDIQNMERRGMTPENTADFWRQYHEAVEANKTAEEKARVDYYNSERLRVELEIQAARAKSSSSERAEQRKEAEATAAFWLEYHKKLAEMEAREREEQARFWLEYRKLVLRLQEDSGRSHLAFGLLR